MTPDASGLSAALPGEPDLGAVSDAVVAAYLGAYHARINMLKSKPPGGSGVLAVAPLIMSRLGHHGFGETHAIAFGAAVGKMRGAHLLVVEDISNTPCILRTLNEVMGGEHLHWYVADLATLVSHEIAGLMRKRS